MSHEDKMNCHVQNCVHSSNLNVIEIKNIIEWRFTHNSAGHCIWRYENLDRKGVNCMKSTAEPFTDPDMVQ